MAGLISSATLEQVRAASDIVEVIGAYVPLKRAGANFVALCPFHREKTPSFNVNPHRQIFHCFGCHKGGDVFTFVREQEGLTFVEAVRRLAQRAGIALELEEGGGDQRARHVKEQLRTIHEQITVRWQGALRKEACGQLARDYLGRRGVSGEAIELFRLGCAPEAWDDTVNWARSKGYDLGLVEQAGLIIRKEGTDRYYDRFRGRLIFPICDEQGRVIGFSGRVLGEAEQRAKYVNSPETPLFSKGKVFFGLDKSKRALLEAESAVVCEGQLDMIACYLAGVRNVVAPQGTALTSEQARILKRYVEEVILCFDSDAAGQGAALRSLDSLLQAGLAVRVALIPAPHDPDSYIREAGPEAFRALLERAEGFFDFYLGYLCREYDPDTDRGRMVIVREMAQNVRKTADEVLQDTYAQKTALRLGVSVEACRAEFRKRGQAAAARPGPEPDTEPVGEPEVSRPSQPEFWLLRFLLTGEGLMEWAAAHLDLAWVRHPAVRRVVSRCLQAEGEGGWRGVAQLLGDFEEDPEARSLITEAAAEGRVVEDLHRNLAAVVLRLRNQWIDRQLEQLNRRLLDPGLGEGEQEALLREKTALRALKGEPLTARTADGG